ncbi:MAG TPA: sigma-54 dependent transcriptional regulator [Holophagaceae bacterium]|nr:sigma-54 dependent transcriptional regulator [Holophagaceae bacterium]
MNARSPRVLLVDDHFEMAEMLADGLSERGFQTLALSNVQTALRSLEEGWPDALVTDLRMAELDGLGLLARSRELDPERPVIVMTAYGAIDSAVESIRQGAYHYLTKPFKLDELEIFLRRALEDRAVRSEAESLRKALHTQFSSAGLVGRSGAMREVYDLMERIAPADVPVLLLGETGTGKGLVARALHGRGPRASRPFVAVNCAALPEQLLESELFGHRKGAFTGAVTDRVGLFQEADGGTIFLDEIGDLPLSLQAKLLHVLERHVIRPLGSAKEVEVDARIMAATHRDLRQMVAAGTFREDLLYRLDVVSLELPPLRHHKEDLPELVEHFLALAKGRHPHSPVERLSPEVMGRLMDYRWPGNVRELVHLLERLTVLGRTAQVELADLPSALNQVPDRGWSAFDEILPSREVQRRYAAWVLDKVGGSKARAAEALGIDVKTLGKWLSDSGPAESETDGGNR